MKPSIQLDESDDSPKVSFLKEFSPKRSFVYCYFIEKKYSEKSPKKSEEKKVLYGINFASDIQRFYYYPETKDIYTFLGFKNQNQLEVAIFQPSLRNAALNRQFYYFPLQDLPSYLTPPVSENIKIDDSSESLGSLKPINRKKASLFIFLEYFKPIDGLFYCYFEEKNTPSGFVSSISLNNFTFTPQTVVDIQSSVYFPGTKKIYSFYGFKNKRLLLKAIKHSTFEFKDIYNLNIYDKKKKKETITSIN